MKTIKKLVEFELDGQPVYFETEISEAEGIRRGGGVDTLIKSAQFHLPSKKCSVRHLKLSSLRPQNSRLNAQKKTAAAFYSGKKKCYAQKAQIIAKMNTGLILAAACLAAGRCRLSRRG